MFGKGKSQRSRGHAVIEVLLMAPWIFFLFMGTVDFGFYAYAAIATQNAARGAADQISANSDAAGRQPHIVAAAVEYRLDPEDGGAG